MTDEIYDDLLKTLTKASGLLAGQLRTLKAAPPEELTAALLGEFRVLAAHALDQMDEGLRALAAAIASSPRQTTVRDFNVAVTYNEEADRVR